MSTPTYRVVSRLGQSSDALARHVLVSVGGELVVGNLAALRRCAVVHRLRDRVPAHIHVRHTA